MNLRFLTITITLAAAVSVAGATPGDTHLIALHPTASNDVVAQTLFINRCVGGCPITGADVDDANAHVSSIPCLVPQTCNAGGCFCTQSGGTWTVTEFQNNAGMTGAR